MSLENPIVLVVVALLLLILIVSLYARYFAKKDLRLFTEVAKKHKGKVSIDSFTSWAKVTFPHSNTEVTVYQRKGIGGKPARTCLRCNVTLPDYIALHIARGVTGETSIRELSQWLLVPEMELGSDEFNEVFITHGNDRDFLVSVVSSTLQKLFLSLRAKDPTLLLLAPRKPYYKKENSPQPEHSLEFSVNDVPRNIQDVEKLIRDGLLIMDEVLDAGS